jgi:hypothetical protein
MNKQEKFKVLNFSNTVCFLTSGNRSYQISAWKNGIPGFANIHFEEIEYAAARTALFRNGVLGFEEKHKEELYEALHIDGEKIWTREKIYDLLVKGDKVLRQMLLDTNDRATLNWIRGEALKIKNTEEFVLHSVVSLIEKRNLELARGQVTTRLSLDEGAAVETAPVKREEFDSLMKKNAELTEQLEALMAMLKQNATPVEQKNEEVVAVAPEDAKADNKPAAKRGPKKKE